MPPLSPAGWSGNTPSRTPHFPSSTRAVEGWCSRAGSRGWGGATVLWAFRDRQPRADWWLRYIKLGQGTPVSTHGVAASPVPIPLPQNNHCHITSPQLQCWQATGCTGGIQQRSLGEPGAASPSSLMQVSTCPSPPPSAFPLQAAAAHSQAQPTTTHPTQKVKQNLPEPGNRGEAREWCPCELAQPQCLQPHQHRCQLTHPLGP